MCIRDRPCTGASRDHVVAFHRGDDVVAVAGRWTVRLAESGCGDTSLTLPPGDWTDRLSQRSYAGAVAVAEVLADLPVALLVKSDG